MNERPIRCTGDEVRAILAGRQKQLRRPIARAVPEGADEVFFWAPGQKAATTMPRLAASGLWAWRSDSDEGEDGWLRPLGACPYGQPGDRLWVRETWGRRELGSFGREKWDPVYRATDEEAINRRYRKFRWIPSIRMPREVSRLTLDVLAVRVERLQDISEEDARAEGFELSEQHFWQGYDRRIGGAHCSFMVEAGAPAPAWMEQPRAGVRRTSARSLFCSSWDSLHGKRRGTGWNPWVWVVSFKRLEAQHG